MMDVKTTPASSIGPSRQRRLRRASLIVGTIVSVGLVIAATWVPLLSYAAVAVALICGFLAVWAALTEYAEHRTRMREEAAAERAAHRETIQSLHASQREVLEAVDVRNQSLHAELRQTGGELRETRLELGQVRLEVVQLRGDNEALRLDNQALRTENAELKSRIPAEGEAADEADVVSLPRRRATEESGDWQPTDAPTVVNLDLQRLASPFVADVVRHHAN